MNQANSDFQQNAENANEAGVRSANNSTDAVNRNVAQGADASPPISVEWYEALIQQQRMNDEKIKTTGSIVSAKTGQANSAFLSAIGDTAHLVSTLAPEADKIGG